mmetsp:Transcript_15991/g.22037  ORF Transcript_15991/g.22037 Transcript_15991/m.22037 type:complete len:676 (+) Transcript_15991:32-2059(+)
MIIEVLTVFTILYIRFTTSSDNPISVQPPLIRPATEKCVVTLISQSSCSYWSEVIMESFNLPTDCLPPWSKVILDVSASEYGTQFDRYGALWLGNIELLRTTTPEPTAAGIAWHIEKDVTLYGSYFTTPNLTAYLAIPNNVDSTYTGVIQIEATLTFYKPDLEGKFPPLSLPIVLPLTSATQYNNPFSAMQVTSNQSLSYSVQLSASNITSLQAVHLDIFASAHGCEEFFYSNIPSDAAASYGICGGGVYRELQVFIDGQLAAIAMPFPVIYTGGINPLLWRPLTGMMSFDIPSHRLDLTPFAGVLLDGGVHSISLTVLNNDIEGYWLLDAALLLTCKDSPFSYDLNEANNVVGGSIDSYIDSGTILSEERHLKKRDDGQKEILFTTAGHHSLAIISFLKYSDGTTRSYSLKMALITSNENALVGESTAITQQLSQQSVESQQSDENGQRVVELSENRYPLYVEDYYMQDATSFDMQATVFYELDCLKQWLWLPADKEAGIHMSYAVMWNNRIGSNATYNRTLDHSVLYNQNDTAKDSFRIRTSALPPHDDGGGFCYSRSATAAAGTVWVDRIHGEEDCGFPSGLSFCGYGLCGPLSLTGTQQVAHGAAKRDADSDMKSTSAFKSIGEKDGKDPLFEVEEDKNGLAALVLEERIPLTMELTTRRRRNNGVAAHSL